MTTIRQRHAEMGQLAVKLLFDRIASSTPGEPEGTMVIVTSLPVAVILMRRDHAVLGLVGQHPEADRTDLALPALLLGLCRSACSCSRSSRP
jgi:hypothetical protein